MHKRCFSHVQQNYSQVNVLGIYGHWNRKTAVVVFQILTDSNSALTETALQIPHFFPMPGSHMVNNLHESLKPQHNLQKKGQWRHHKNTLWENSEDECCSNAIYVILNKEFHLNKFYFILPLLFSLYNTGHKWHTTTWVFPLSPAELPKSADTLLNSMTEKWNFL